MFCHLLIAFAVTVSFIIVSVAIAVSVVRPLWTRQSINELLKLYIVLFLFNSYWIVLRLLTSRSQSSTSSNRVERLHYVDVPLSLRASPLLSSPPSPMQNIVGAFSRKIDTDFHQINCSREGCTQQRVLKCVCVLQVAPSTLVPRPATPSTPATLISSNKQLKIKIKNFLLPPLWLSAITKRAGNREYEREREWEGSGGMLSERRFNLWHFDSFPKTFCNF